MCFCVGGGNSQQGEDEGGIEHMGLENCHQLTTTWWFILCFTTYCIVFESAERQFFAKVHRTSLPSFPKP